MQKSTSPKEMVYNIEPKKPILENKLVRTAIFALIASISVIIISQALPQQVGVTTIKDVGLIFGIMLAVIPFTLHQLKEVKRRDSIDRNMPVFLLGLLSSVQSGANIIKAIELSADRNVGSLTPELKNLRANLSWGIPMEEAFENFAKRTGTRVSRRVTTLLEMAIKIGGDISENLEMIQKHVSEMQNIEKSRKSALSPYTYTIYISFFVFLAVSVLLTSSFFTEIAKVQDTLLAKGGAKGTMFSSLAEMNVSAMSSSLFNMGIIEALFGGLAAGKIGDGSYVAGTKHVVIMVIATIIAFNIM
jgi:flagellar protein FlaJ